MAKSQANTRIRTRPHGNAPSLELHLSRSAFGTSKHLSGVVVLRLSRPTNIRALTISCTGRESPSGASLARALRSPGFFFQREQLLSGREQPRLFSDKISQFWNALLWRDRGRTLSAGEHTYPFSIPLPASLPSSYEGRAGKIDYRVTTRLQFPVGRSLRISTDVPVVSIPRAQKGRPVALSYPTARGTVHSSEINVSMELPHRTVRMGSKISGRFSISNPHKTEIPEVVISLESCEWVRLASEKELQRDRVAVQSIVPQDPNAESIGANFELNVPDNTSPTIEGTAISVIWLLKLSLKTSPPLEVKTPVTVYASLE